MFENYKFLFIPIISAITAQVIKFISESLHYRHLDFKRLLNGNGGMPSTHSAFVSSLTIAIGLQEGYNSPMFAICFVFSLVVLFDAMGVRLQSEKQAEAINKIGKEINDGNPKFSLERLKDQIGHEPFEVLIGMFVGIFIATILMW